MANLAELALKEAVLKSIEKTIESEMAVVKGQMQRAMTASGASQARATLPDGTRVATVSLPDPRPSASVTDTEAFLKWVKEEAPGEVTLRMVELVRPAYQAALLREMSARGRPEVVDQATGEVVTVPGVEVSAPKESSHSVRMAAGGVDRVVEALRAGDLAHLVLPQLGASGGGRGE